VSPSFVPGCLVGGETAVVCSWLFGACLEGHGRFAFVPAWLFSGGETAVVCSRLFGACFEGYGRLALGLRGTAVSPPFVPGCLVVGETAVSRV
jgi:hypothetical protein